MRAYSKSQGKFIDVPDQEMATGPTTTAMPSNSPVTGDESTPDELRYQKLQTAMLTASLTDPKNAAKYASILAIAKPPAKKAKTSGVSEINKINAYSGLMALKKLEDELGKGGESMVWRAKLPGILGNMAGASQYKTAGKEVADVYTRLRTGAALNEEEQKFYQSQLPQPGDTPADMRYKISLFRNLYSRVAGLNTSDNVGSEEPSLPSSWQDEE